MATGGTVLVPVDSEQHVYLLREYRKLLQSTMGPSGSCKAIVTGGGYMEVAATSTALASRLELASPVCKYINNMVAGLVDHGLYCGVLLSHLLEQQWQQRKHSKSRNMQIIAILVKELKTFLFSENVCVKLDFDSIQNFLPLVQTIITSKCPVLLSGMDVNRLCIEIIRVFLNCIDEETNLINRVYTKVESGINTFSSHKGLLYTVSDSHNIEIARGLTGDITILVFVLKLQDNDELLFSGFDEFKQILEYSVQFGVKIVACQKTVSSEIKLFLRRKKIVLLERMGSDFTKMLIDLSHAFPISHLNIEESETDKIVGHLSSIEHVRFNECDYLVLHNKNVPVGTLLIQTSSKLGEDFIKVACILVFVKLAFYQLNRPRCWLNICRTFLDTAPLKISTFLKALILQALTALRTVAVHPLLILGGGCLETWIIGQIHQLKEDRKEDDFRLVSTWVQRALQSTCSAAELDTLYHHGWREESDSCDCGLVGRREVELGGGAWLTLREVVNSQVRLQRPRQPATILRPDVLLESQHQKLQVICSVFEAFANLSDIGLIVYES